MLGLRDGELKSASVELQRFNTFFLLGFQVRVIEYDKVSAKESHRCIQLHDCMRKGEG